MTGMMFLWDLNDMVACIRITWLTRQSGQGELHMAPPLDEGFLNQQL